MFGVKLNEVQEDMVFNGKIEYKSPDISFLSVYFSRLRCMTDFLELCAAQQLFLSTEVKYHISFFLQATEDCLFLDVHDCVCPRTINTFLQYSIHVAAAIFCWLNLKSKQLLN